jgi:hypothetical protein
MKVFIVKVIKLITNPAQFLQEIPNTQWNEDSLTFAMIVGWIMAFSLTFVVFVNSYLPTGLGLVDGIYGQKLLIVIPVLLIMGFAFFVMTVLILGGLLNLAVVGIFFGFAALLNFLLILLGGTGNLFDMARTSLYASGALLFGLINIFLMVLVKYGFVPVPAWIMGEKIVFMAASLYLFYAFIQMSKIVHKVNGIKAFLASTVPLIILVVFNLVFSAKILPKLLGFLS